MNIHRLLGAFLLLISFSAVSLAQNYPLKYCLETVDGGVGADYSNKVYELGAAIKLDQAVLKPFKGGKISAIKLGTISTPAEGQGTINSVQNLKVFIRSSLTGENLYVQSVDEFTKENLGGWYEVKLDQPFELDGSDIFVGYTMNSNSIPLGFDRSDKPDLRASWVGTDNKWESFTKSGNACIQAMVSSDKFVFKKALLEHFTTTSCGNCPAVHTMLENMLGKDPRVVWVSHHAGFLQGDVYTTDIDTKYLAFYNVNGSTYAPAIMFDRMNLSGYGAPDSQGNKAPGPIFAPVTNDLVKGLLSVRTDLPSFVTVDMDGAYDPETRKVTVKVYGSVNIPELLGADPTINVFLSEDGIKGIQNGASTKEYIHDRVFRDAITGAWGDELKMEEDGTYSKTYEYTLKENWVPENMNLIAFVSNVDSKDINNYEVYNANSTKLLQDFTGIDSEKSNPVSLYTSGSSIVINGEYTSVCIYDYTGKLMKVLNADENSCLMEKGIYMVKVLNGEQSFVQKVAVN